MIIWKNLGLRKFISFYIQLFKFSPSVNVEVKQILFYLNLKNGNRVCFNVSLRNREIIEAFRGTTKLSIKNKRKCNF